MAARCQGEVEALRLPGQVALGVHFIDEFIDISLYGRINCLGSWQDTVRIIVRVIKSFQGTRGVVIRINFVNQASPSVGLDVDKHAPSLREPGDQLVSRVVLDPEGKQAGCRIVVQVLDRCSQKQLLLGPVSPRQQSHGINPLALSKI